MSQTEQILRELEQLCAATDDRDDELVLQIEMLDNPGWLVTLAPSDRLGGALPPDVERSANDWVKSAREAGTIRLAGGPGNLLELLGFAVGIARQWKDRP